MIKSKILSKKFWLLWKINNYIFFTSRSNIELKSLNKLGKVYIANGLKENKKKTLTKNPFSEWIPIEFDYNGLQVKLNLIFFNLSIRLSLRRDK